MTRAEAIRHNARLIRAQVRGKGREERWNTYACLMLGMLAPIVQVARIWHDDRVAFRAGSITWAQARNR